MMIRRPWGGFVILYEDNDTWLKQLIINPGGKLSLQKHLHRREFWYPHSTGAVGIIGKNTIDLQKGLVYDVPSGISHRLWNPTDTSVAILEWAVGVPDENDIHRIEDEYGRALFSN